MSEGESTRLAAIAARTETAASWPGEWCQKYAEDVPWLVAELTQARAENNRLRNALDGDTSIGQAQHPRKCIECGWYVVASVGMTKDGGWIHFRCVAAHEGRLAAAGFSQGRHERRQR